MPKTAKLFEFASQDLDALIKPVIPYEGEQEPIKAWEMLQELRNMWNADQEDEYMHYVHCDWVEVYDN